MVTEILSKLPKPFYYGIIASFLMLSACASHPTPIPKSANVSTPARPNNVSSDELLTKEPPEDLKQDPVPLAVTIQNSAVSEEIRDEGLSSSKKNYPPLIYGAPKPLVCSEEVFAKETLKDRPNLQLMWEHYLYDSPKGVWAEVGGAVEV